jgi:hypothetical protein
MRKDCSLCTEAILEGQATSWVKDDSIFEGVREIHKTCAEERNIDASTGKPELTLEEKKLLKEKYTADLEENITGSVITKIDLSWGNAFFLCFQFIVVLNIILIPFYLILMIINQ